MFNPSYLVFQFQCNDEDTKELLIALLTNIGFEAFEEIENVLKAYILESLYDASELTATVAQFETNNVQLISQEKLEDKNWNEVWESNFQPVWLEPKIWIRSDHHPIRNDADYTITINPAMAFGTGHHPTTAMMLSAIASLPLANQNILDFGTGTGILLILAAQKNPAYLIGTDNDPNCIENCKINFELNNVTGIDLLLAEDLEAIKDNHFNYIFANINRHIILAHINSLCSKLVKNGHVLMSGILCEDMEAINKASTDNNLVLFEKKEQEGWLFLNYVKQ
jgi:ribosomal protein L11 methyltransferase